MKLVYLAGPDVFFENAIQIGLDKKKACAVRNMVGLYPLDNEMAEGLSPMQMALRIGHANVALLNQATHVVANLNAFRGPSADSGTVWECGYAAGRGIPVFGYADSETEYANRVRETIRLSSTHRRGPILVDRNGCTVEEFGQYDNLMITPTGVTRMFYNDPGIGFQTGFEKALDWIALNG